MLSAQKTKITHIDDGFDFLGWNVRKYKGKLLIKPSQKNVKAFLDDIRVTAKANNQAKQINLIRLLNPKIRGWANYHKAAVAKVIFSKVDNEIWKLLWRWALRRHPKKSGEWIRRKYFSPNGSRGWGFNATFLASDGKPRRMTLVKASDTVIRRHNKIKMDANPYDPKWEPYFEDRLGLKMKDSQKGKRQLLILWLEQAGKCSICSQQITKETGWRVHHVLSKSKGGKDNLSNLALIHPNCLYKTRT